MNMSLQAHSPCDPEVRFLSVLFAELKSQGVEFAVMGNHEHLPFSAGGSDLDIIVATEDGKVAKTAVLKSVFLAGGAPIGIVETVGFFKVYALGRSGDESCQWWGLRVDVNLGLFFRGHRLLKENALLPIRWHRDIPILADELQGVLGVLKEVCNNGIFPTRYSKLAQLALPEWSTIKVLLAPMGERALCLLKVMISSGTSEQVSGRDCQKIRWAISHEAVSGRAWSSLSDRVRFEWSKLNRYLRPSGIVVAILGVDGSGKSSIIDSMLPALNAATHNGVVIKHLRPAVLPPLARLKGTAGVPDAPVLNPQGATPSGKIGSLVRLVYLTMDYVLGYWLWTRPRIAKQPTIVLFDRYAYDMELDPRRFRIGLSARVAGWFASLAPKPDVIICLHGTPEVIAARKNELSVEETRRQIEALRRFARRESRAVLVSTDVSVEETRDQALGALSSYLRGKAKRRS